jgi:hypothetical protein
MIQAWIKLRDDIDTDPKVLRIARLIAKADGDQFFVARTGKTDLLGDRLDTISETVSRDVSVACLRRLWCNVATHGRVELLDPDDTESSTACIGGDLETIGLITGMPSFGKALLKVGWVQFDKERELLFFPNFLEFNELRHLIKGPSKNALKLRAWKAKQKAEKDEAERLRKLAENQSETVSETVSETDEKPPGNPIEEKKKENLSSTTTTARPRNLGEALNYAASHRRSDVTGKPVTAEITTAWFDERIAANWQERKAGHEYDIADWRADLRIFTRHWYANLNKRHHGTPRHQALQKQAADGLSPQQLSKL